MTDIDKTRLIEAYHQKKLKGDDDTLFKQELKNDPNFQEEVNGFAAIFKGLDGLHVDEFKNRLAQMESKYQHDSTNIVPINNVIRPIKKLYFAAAAIALLICATIAYNFTTQDVFSDHFQASLSIGVHLGSTRGDLGISTEEQIKKRAFSFYQQKDYSNTIKLLKDYVQTYPNSAAVDYQSLLVLGVSQLAIGETEKAIKNFDLVIMSNNSSYKQEAEWMWVLAQFKLENGAATKSMLESIISQDGHTYQDVAKEVLSNL